MPALAGRREQTGAEAAAAAPAAPGARPFSLARWFGLVSAAVIIALAFACALFMERFLTAHLLGRDSDIMMRFINGVVAVEEAGSFFESSGRDPGAGDMAELFRHLGSMPGVLRANAYGQDRSIVWSTEPELMGQRFLDNPELEEAFRGGRPVDSGMMGETEKREHALLSDVFFVENYLPIWDADEGRVIGVVEFYRTPVELLEAIRKGRRDIWLGAALAGAAVYLALFGLVLRADRVIRRQTAALGESQTMAALGEMASAVAHSLRNPLAAIRSSAELALDEPEETERRALMTDVLAHVDGMTVSIGQYLSYGGLATEAEARADIGAAIDRTIGMLGPQLRRARIRVIRTGSSAAEVAILPLMLDQVLHTVIANAIEAMPEGGEIRMAIEPDGPGHVLLRARDSGPGMTPEQIDRAFAPFATTKRNGLGMGLPIARQILARQGGRIALESAPGAGTEAVLRLRRA